MKTWWRWLLFLFCLDASVMLVLQQLGVDAFHRAVATGLLNIAIAIWVW